MPRQEKRYIFGKEEVEKIFQRKLEPEKIKFVTMVNDSLIIEVD